MFEVCAIKLHQWRQAAQQAASAASISPEEVDWLLIQVGGIDSLTLRLLSFPQTNPLYLTKPLQELEQLWQQRLTQKIPIQYLAGFAPWRHFLLKVSPDVLIPRPETELIIDIIQEKISQIPLLAEGHWVDLGTGSGAIALGLTEIMPKAQIHAVDCSKEALLLAKFNAKQLAPENKIKFYQGYWWEPLKQLQGKIHGMVSNPPYIPTELIPGLMEEVVNYEPHLALDGGIDGMAAITHLVETAPSYLVSGGLWLVEIMASQGEAVVKLLQKQGSYDKIEIIPDLAGIDRFIFAVRK